MKKFIAFVLTALLMLSLCACEEIPQFAELGSSATGGTYNVPPRSVREAKASAEQAEEADDEILSDAVADEALQPEATEKISQPETMLIPSPKGMNNEAESDTAAVAVPSPEPTKTVKTSTVKKASADGENCPDGDCAVVATPCPTCPVAPAPSCPPVQGCTDGSTSNDSADGRHITVIYDDSGRAIRREFYNSDNKLENYSDVSYNQATGTYTENIFSYDDATGIESFVSGSEYTADVFPVVPGE